MDVKVYKTSETYLAAYLRSQGLRLLKLNTVGKKTTFVFEDKDNRRELVRNYYSDEALMSPRHLCSVIRDLKTLIKSSQQQVEII